MHSQVSATNGCSSVTMNNAFLSGGSAMALTTAPTVPMSWNANKSQAQMIKMKEKSPVIPARQSIQVGNITQY